MVIMLIALAPLALVLFAIRNALFLWIVAPTIAHKGTRFWLNLGSTQGIHIKSYLAELPPERLRRWPNWYLKYSNYIVGATIALWCLALVAAR
jgi:hypothetical protein